jgi:hypothetical protein
VVHGTIEVTAGVISDATFEELETVFDEVEKTNAPTGTP